jgi:hypothetical protein
MPKVKKEWLAGLTFRTASIKEIKQDGRMVKKSIPTERPLEAGDVLAVRERAGKVILVIADGRKHEVDPDAALKAKKKAEEEAEAKKKADKEPKGSK